MNFCLVKCHSHIFIFVQQSFKQRFKTVRKIFFHHDLWPKHFTFYFLSVFSTKGGMPSHDFVETAPQTPDVNCEVVALIQKLLWSHVGRSAGHWICFFINIKIFANSKVREFYVTVPVEQNVFRFQVSVHNSAFVEICESKNDLCTIELCFSFCEMTIFVYMEEEISPIDILKYHVECEGSLECIMQFQYELVVHF